MIIITGAAGFIASNLVARLNSEGFRDLVLVDDFSRSDKQKNFSSHTYTQLVHRDDFAEWLRGHQRFAEFVFHLGARTDTTEFDHRVFEKLNLNYSKQVFEICTEFGIPLVYASSAACYGMGEHGYSDDDAVTPLLKPLNPYGESKLAFDKWVLAQEKKPYFWAGVRFFNVFGPNEYHKGRMASVVWHAYRQISETGKMRLFRSHKPGVADGNQQRDFIYVNDAVDVLLFFMLTRKNSGIYNLGTGVANTYRFLAESCFGAMSQAADIEFIDTPADIRNTYQYYTCADMNKLRLAGYNKAFTPLAEAIEHYVKDYLIPSKYL